MNEAEFIKLFEKLYVDNLHKIRYFTYNYLEDNGLAEDVTQEVFAQVWQNRHSLDFDRNMLPYLFLCAKNRCLNILRKTKYEHTYSDRKKADIINMAALNDNSLDIIYGKEMESIINETIKLMTDKVRTTFMMSKYEGLTNEEIAKKNGISIKTVEYRMSVALKIMRKLLIIILFMV